MEAFPAVAKAKIITIHPELETKHQTSKNRNKELIQINSVFRYWN